MSAQTSKRGPPNGAGGINLFLVLVLDTVVQNTRRGFHRVPKIALMSIGGREEGLACADLLIDLLNKDLISK
jgi:hypothetical protein